MVAQFPNQTALASFDIRNFVDQLEPAKEKNKYVCPACTGHNLSINPSDGKYQCFNGCECRDIREAVKPWSEVLEENKLGYTQKTRRIPVKTKKPAAKPKVLNLEPSELRLCRLSGEVTTPPSHLPDFIPKSVSIRLLDKGATPEELKQITSIAYDYGNGRKTHRFTCPCTTDSKGTVKTFSVSQVDPLTNKTTWKKEGYWPAYKQSEAIAIIKATDGIPVLLAHEGEKCVEASRLETLASITWVGNCSDGDILKSLTQIKHNTGKDFLLAYCADNDETGWKKAQRIKEVCDKAEVLFVAIDLLKIQPNLQDKGDVADILGSGMTGDELANLVLAQILEQTQAFTTVSQPEPPQEVKWTQSLLAEEVAEIYREKLAWHSRNKSWYWYGHKLVGQWSEVCDELVARLVIGEAKSRLGATFRYDLITGTIKFLKSDLLVEEWSEALGLIPMQDGVLDPVSMKLLPHAPGYRFLWQLPYKWSERVVGCQVVTDWLKSAMMGDENLVQLLRAYLKAIVTGRYDLHRFLEGIGAGGTGKSTFQRLATALVGKENVTVTTLKQLEGNRFESASLYGKRLVLITDSERYGGEVATLKAITGGDEVRNERKGIQQTKGFTYTGMVMVGANEAIQSSDYTSGMRRRRLTVPFNNQIPAHLRRNLESEFEPYLPGLLQWVLEMSDADMVRYVVDTEHCVSAIAAFSNEFLLDTNPLAEWLDNCCIRDDKAKTYVGTRDKPAEHYLYASYCRWMEGTGSKSLSLRRFSDCLVDLCKNQLGINTVSKSRNNQGAYINGVDIRHNGHQNEPRFITGIAQSDDEVTDCESSVTSQVTSQTLASDGSDGSDGLFLSENISNSENHELETVNTNQPELVQKELETVNTNQPELVQKELEESNYPSHPSHPSLPTVSPVTASITVTDSSSLNPSLVNILANAELIRECIAVQSSEMIDELLEEWTEEFKESVWNVLTLEERSRVKALKRGKTHE